MEGKNGFSRPWGSAGMWRMFPSVYANGNKYGYTVQE